MSRPSVMIPCPSAFRITWRKSCTSRWRTSGSFAMCATAAVTSGVRNRVRHVGAADAHEVVVGVGADRVVERLPAREHRRGVIEVNPLLQGVPGERAVGRTGVLVPEAEHAGRGAGDTRLAAAGGTVHRDHGLRDEGALGQSGGDRRARRTGLAAALAVEAARDVAAEGPLGSPGVGRPVSGPSGPPVTRTRARSGSSRRSGPCCCDPPSATVELVDESLFLLGDDRHLDDADRCAR